jgi:hypothetical protein
MVAAQLFRGDREPFLGMDAADGHVEAWLWNAAAQADLERYADVDTAYPNMAVDQYPFERQGEGPRAHAPDRQPRDYITAWAAGNPRSDPSRPLAGSNLEAKGLKAIVASLSIVERLSIRLYTRPTGLMSQRGCRGHSRSPTPRTRVWTALRERVPRNRSALEEEGGPFQGTVRPAGFRR